MSIVIPDEILRSTRLTAAEIMQELALASIPTAAKAPNNFGQYVGAMSIAGR